MSFENLSSSTKRRSLFGSRKKDKDREDEPFSIWGSLKELRQSDVLKQPQHAMFLEGTYSEPSLFQNPDEVSPQPCNSLDTCRYHQLLRTRPPSQSEFISVQHHCRGAEK
jgi:hypothetical protein